MASGVLPKTDSGLADLRACDAVIEQQLNRTRQQVRLVELATVVAGWLVGTLGLLLTAALIDHWLVPLGAFGRWGMLLVLVVGSAAYAWKFVLPLALKRINPLYAAQAIEHAQPSLKNSLINFLLLRGDSRGVKEGIMQAVERQAAKDIAAVPVDLAVDRTRAIHLGYALVAMLAVATLYKMLSPKDPMQTAARVLAPWASIARPSRVQITHIEPGNSEVYQGQFVTVSAMVAGLREGEIARVLYSTADGRALDRAVPLTTAADGLHQQCLLPEDNRQAMPGMQQNLTYRIVAGDATSESFTLRVRPVPTMLVERVEYNFPAYTKRTPLTQERNGDVQAVEGTRVTIHARANQAVKAASIEFDPPMGGGPAGETLSMQFDGDRAWGTFTLQLLPDRRTPSHASYQLRFYNERGERSEQPTLHRIDVLPDLPPEVQILSPAQPKVEVPLDGEQAIEVRAVDPDFGLMKVGLRGLRGEEVVVDRSLMEAKDIGQSQGTFKFTFRPAKHGLQPGDEVHYWAWAEDGRMSPQGQNEPNAARTPTYLFVITAPVKPAADDSRPGKPNPSDEPPPAGEKPEPGDARGPMSSKEKKEDPFKEEKPEEPRSDKKEDESPSKPGEKKSDSSDKKEGSEKAGQQKSADKEGGKKQGKQEGNQQSSGGKGGQSGAQGGAAGKGNEKESDNAEAGGDASGGAAGKQSGNKSGEKQAGDGAEGGQPTGNKSGEKSSQSGSKQAGSGDVGSDAESTREAGGEGGEPTAGKAGQGSRGGQATKPQHDGEAFERILERMKEQEKERGSGDEQSDKPGEKDQGSRQQGSAGKPGEQSKSGQGDAGSEAGSEGNAGQQGSSARKPDAAKAGSKQNGAGGAAGDPKPDLAGDKHGKEDGTGAGKKPEEKGAGPNKPDSRQGAGGKQDGAPGEGGNPQNADRTDMGKKPGESGADQGEKKDPGMGDNGSSGAGQNSKDKTGSGAAVEPNRDKPKTDGNESSAPKDGETSAASGSKKQSNSKGGESGDQSGGGKKGAGQSAGQEGNDSSGSKSSADQGAGKSNERGSGETGPKAGQEQKTDGQTGSSGNEAGKGSSSRPGEAGQEPGGASGADSAQPENAKGTQATERGKQRGNGPVDGGGIPGETPAGDGPPPKEGTTPDGEAANLDYAKKATDLALDYLKDQEHNPDPELLKRLGWSKEELQEFVRRWEAMQTGIDKPEEKRELDETLRSLGLRPPRQNKRAGGKETDNLRDLRDTGGRTQPPSKYREQFEAFRKGKR